jgi:hypothetical protein
VQVQVQGEGKGDGGEGEGKARGQGGGESEGEREERLHKLEQELDFARREMEALTLGRRRGGYVERVTWRWPAWVPGRARAPEPTLALEWTAAPPSYLERLQTAARRLAVLERLVASALEPAESAIVHVRAIGDASEYWVGQLASLYQYLVGRHAAWPPALLGSAPDAPVRDPSGRTAAVLVRMPRALELLAGEPGLHELRFPHSAERATLARVRVLPLDPGEEVEAALARAGQDDAGERALGVVRKYMAGEHVHDVALGRSAPAARADDDEDIAEALRPAFHEVVIAGWIARTGGSEAPEPPWDEEDALPDLGRDLDQDPGAGLGADGGASGGADLGADGAAREGAP